MSDIHFALSLATAPSAEPLLAATAKSHLRVDTADDDTLIGSLIEAARDKLELDTGRALITQTWDLKLDSFPASDYKAILIPKPPLVSVSSITYIDTDGDEQTWSSDEYRVDSDSEPGRITPAYGYSWPTARDVTGAVTVRFICGYGDAGSNVDPVLLQAMLMLIGHYYENRESVISGTTITAVPQAYEFLIAPKRTFNF